MKLTFAAVIILGSSLLPMLLAAQSTPPAALLILAKRDQTLAIVDPVTLKILVKVPVGNDPHEVAASADGKTAYVTNYGGGAFNTITPVDLVEQKPLAPIDLGPLRGPHGIVFVDGKVWFTAEAAKAIARFDPTTNKVDWILGTGQNRTHMIFVWPDLSRILTTNVNSGTVSIIDKTTVRVPGGPPPSGAYISPGPLPLPGPKGTPRTDWDETVVKVGNGSEGFDVSPDGKEAWVANAQNGTVSIIDVAAKKVTDTLAANMPRANRLKFTPDGKLVLISSLGGGNLAVFDAATRKEVKRIPVGHGAAGILIPPDGSRAFVACSPDNYVVVLDLKSLEVTGKIEPGQEPDGLAWAVRH